MINHKIYYPLYPLNQYVDFIWYGKSNNLDLSISHYAPIFTELIFNYKGKFSIQGDNIESEYSNNNKRIISGLKTKPFNTTVKGEYENIGLILKPYCYKVLQENISKNILDNVSEILYLNFFESSLPNFIKIEKALLEFFQRHKVDSILIDFENYLNSKIIIKGDLQHFNSTINISQKSFINKFKSNYFITPGEYIKLKKVNNAIKIIENNKNTKLTEVGLDSGFYDQSHFNRIFKEFSGETPKKFIQRLDR